MSGTTRYAIRRGLAAAGCQRRGLNTDLDHMLGRTIVSCDLLLCQRHKADSGELTVILSRSSTGERL